MKLEKKNMDIINEVYKEKHLSVEDIMLFSRDEIIELTYLLGTLIGYDEKTKDIDSIGVIADETISKLLCILEKRGEM